MLVQGKIANKGGRPRKYHTAEEQRAGNNAARRKRRRLLRERQKQANDDSLTFHFEYCASTKRAKSEESEDAAPEVYSVVPHSRAIARLGDYHLPTDTLCDPLLQDLSPQYKFYIRHFTHHVCQDLVSYDETPGQNPYRSIIASVRDSPLLINVIMANSAMHLVNLHTPKTVSAGRSLDTSMGLGQGREMSITRKQIPGHLLHDHERHALAAKSKALTLLANSLNTTNQENLDTVLACILLLINYELISSGKNDWKVHVEGAKRLIDRFHTPYHFDGQPDSPLRDFAVSDCLTYYVLGSILRPRTDDRAALDPDLDVLPFLQRAEANSYVSCPAMLLQIALSASKLLDDRTGRVTELDDFYADDPGQQARELFDSASNFPVEEWAASVSAQGDLTSRLHVALAHRSAICLYINSAMPSAGLLSRDETQDHVKEIISNLAEIGAKDKLLKGTSWPTFIAGAEASSSEDIQWVVERLQLLWEALPWGYLDTAREMLEVLWAKRARREIDGEGNETWLGYLRRQNHDWIVV